MEHNVILQAIDNDGNMHTWEYYTIKDYLVNENRIYGNSKWKFHYGKVNGYELHYNNSLNLLMRDVGDFQTFCRRKVDRKYIKAEVPKEILDKFLLKELESKRKRIFETISKGINNINNEYNNGGGGLCEYRPGYIEGYDFFNNKGVKISWINQDADVCEGIVSRSAVLSEIKVLIKQGMYLPTKTETKPKIVFYEDNKQLSGQMNIADWLTI